MRSSNGPLEAIWGHLTDHLTTWRCWGYQTWDQQCIPLGHQSHSMINPLCHKTAATTVWLGTGKLLFVGSSAWVLDGLFRKTKRFKKLQCKAWAMDKHVYSALCGSIHWDHTSYKLCLISKTAMHHWIQSFDFINHMCLALLFCCRQWVPTSSPTDLKS